MKDEKEDLNSILGKELDNDLGKKLNEKQILLEQNQTKLNNLYFALNNRVKRINIILAVLSFVPAIISFFIFIGGFLWGCKCGATEWNIAVIVLSAISFCVSLAIAVWQIIEIIKSKK